MVENGQEPLFTEIASPGPGSGPGVINPWRAAARRTRGQ